MKNIIPVCILALVGLFTISGCYTSFHHPAVDANGNRINMASIDITRNCSECHQDEALLQSGSMLPASLENSYDWQFYTNSTWWQDEFDFYPVNSIDSLRGTGPRLPGVNPETINNGITSMPVISAPSLSKKTVPDSNAASSAPKDDRRDFDRRQDTQKPDDQSKGNDGNSSRNR